MTTEKEEAGKAVPKANPIASGQAYIGLCNTRGVALQLYTQRAMQALLVNLAGLAAVIAWISADHPSAALFACSIGALAFGALDSLGMRAIKGSAASVVLWTNKLIQMEQVNKIDGNVEIFSSPEYEDLRKEPAFPATHLLWAMRLCIVMWGIVLFASLAIALHQMGVLPWEKWLASWF